MEFYRPAPLDPAKHVREGFTCGDKSLDDWLRQFSGQNRRGNTAATWVIADSDYAVAAYATLSISAVVRSTAPTALAKSAPAMIPSLLIGRLAVSTNHAGLSLGTKMVHYVLATAAELNVKAACRAVVVNGLNETAYSWWSYLGFTPLDEADPGNLDLFMLCADIEKTIGPPVI